MSFSSTYEEQCPSHEQIRQYLSNAGDHRVGVISTYCPKLLDISNINKCALSLFEQCRSFPISRKILADQLLEIGFTPDSAAIQALYNREFDKPLPSSSKEEPVIKEEIQFLHRKINTLENINKQLNDENKQHQHRIQEVLTTNGQLHKKCEHLEQQNQDLIQQIEPNLNTNKCLENKNIELMAENEKLKTRILAMQKELEALQKNNVTSLTKPPETNKIYLSNQQLDGLYSAFIKLQNEEYVNKIIASFRGGKLKESMSKHSKLVKPFKFIEALKTEKITEEELFKLLPDKTSLIKDILFKYS